MMTPSTFTKLTETPNNEVARAKAAASPLVDTVCRVSQCRPDQLKWERAAEYGEKVHRLVTGDNRPEDWQYNAIIATLHRGYFDKPGLSLEVSGNYTQPNHAPWQAEACEALLAAGWTEYKSTHARQERYFFPPQ